MESTRQQKIARLLQKELSTIFLQYGRNLPGVLITVSEVRITPDLAIARAYLSIFPVANANTVLEKIQDDVKSIRFELGNNMRHQLRIIPELFFHVDETLDHLEHIDRLLNQ